jgi:hypothetical protein
LRAAERIARGSDRGLVATAGVSLAFARCQSALRAAVVPCDRRFRVRLALDRRLGRDAWQELGFRRHTRRGVEGVEGALGRDRELEAIPGAGVLDRNGHGVPAGVPKQENAEAVALASGKFPSVDCFRGDGSSLRLSSR